ncbi:unnamed protein product [Adineta ricciae]|uniref:dihydrolipoyl dehydrogenase n=1 Tax=Adineta ricciae TaxID=249248 RepID=A0A813U459_ADIRI|nr:unnamed protein product [Adineta ricciae]CAF1241259.1 unnamed protein product [Adineta ricciae]
MDTAKSRESVTTDREQGSQLVNDLAEVSRGKSEHTEQYQFDVIVIGSGPGGYTSAIRCAQLGKSVAIVERDLLGGHAVNWGCVPLNSMIASARLIRSIHECDRYGIRIPSYRIDFSYITRHRDEAVKKIRSQLKHFLEKYHIQLYTGNACIVNPHHVLVKPVQKRTYATIHDANGQSPYETSDYTSVRADVEISGNNIIIAAGVEYELPHFVEKNDRKSVDPTELLWRRTIPESLIIIGGGVLGCEIASLYSHLRSNVILIDKNSRLLKCMDEQVSFAVEKCLKANGVNITLNANVERVSNGEVIIQLRQTDIQRTIRGALVVVCVGRKPTFDYKYLEQLGIRIDHEQSTIIIDEKTCQTSIRTIYACGGIVSSCWSWVSCAVRQGHIAANAICCVSENTNNSKFHMATNPAAPFVINVIPAVASVGKIPKSTDNVLIYMYKFHTDRRAIIDSQTWGFVKMWTTSDEPKRFLAVQLAHEAAAEIIQYYSMIISLNLSIRDVCFLSFAHPTYTESIKEACEYVLGQSMNYDENLGL